jgi:hypothetical protein
MPTYCGNNLNHHSLLSGTHVLGTNYQCMRKGIGVGSHLPYDTAYSGVYAPVDSRKFYCGNAEVPPVEGGYLAVGSPSKCLQIGIGVGKSQRAGLGPPAFMYFIRYVLPYIIFFCITVGLCMVLYFIKPKLVTKKDYMNEDVIDWSKFVPYSITLCLVVAIIIWWFWKRFVRKWI